METSLNDYTPYKPYVAPKATHNNVSVLPLDLDSIIEAQVALRKLYLIPDSVWLHNSLQFSLYEAIDFKYDGINDPSGYVGKLHGIAIYFYEDVIEMNEYFEKKFRATGIPPQIIHIVVTPLDK